MKCPKCSSNNPVLAKVCDACGYSPLSPSPEDAEALQLAERINANLAALKAASPAGGFGSTTLGFLILPTAGLAWVAMKAWQVFVHPKRSAGDALLRLGEDLRRAQTSFGTDPSVRALITQANREIDERMSAVRLSAKQTLLGLLAFVAVAAVAGGGTWLASARKAAAEKALLAAAAAEQERRAAAVIGKLGEGSIEDAVAALKRIPEVELAGSLRTQPALAVVQAAAAGDWEAALARTSLIGDAKTRPVVDTALAERALKALGTDYDHTRATSLAARISPEPRRAQALDAAIAAEVRRMIDGNRYQDAKALIATLSSSALREELEARINARLN
jgi:hypothetical protein